MPFTAATLNAFAMTGRESACEIPAMRERCRAFAAVYPPGVGARPWTLRRFEIDAAHLARGYDVAGEDRLDEQVLELASLEEVEAALARWGIDPAGFDAPWKCDAPL
jgi:hypothetical protein